MELFEILREGIQGSKLTFLATCEILRVVLIWTRKLQCPTRNEFFPLLYSFKHCRVNLMAIVSCVWNLIHPFPFLWQRTCSILLSFVSRNALWHGKSFCYEVLQLFHCFYCRLAYSSLRTRSEWGFGIRWNIELATFFECLYFQLANLNFNSHFASLQAWVSSPGIRAKFDS